MNWETLIGPAVTAAVIAGGFGAWSLLVNKELAEKVHRQRLAAERDALERKGEIDRDLAERKATHDRRLTFEKRRVEVAEQVLTDFYEAQRAYEVIRQPMITRHEQKAEDGVPDEVIRNSGYAVQRRVRSYEPLFARMEARRPVALAIFGPEIDAPYQRLIRMHNIVFAAAGAILDWPDEIDTDHMREFIREQNRIAFKLSPEDDVTAQVAAVVMDVERICRPALEAAARA
ncbi:hypothetical protein [Phenylobacterium deserti]|uniref:Uncharacterized protein n=1 Tax=Phenylobacterium deserti TaxID=1914756 RepID=A0A328A9R2_9CAUL|nr:hypothetical protein [Phenylobacterium deserti]RAK51321.1 hypothetical protein DJ018_15365 [Phenylobacterium deserti]